jgi:hypothetical protein
MEHGGSWELERNATTSLFKIELTYWRKFGKNAVTKQSAWIFKKVVHLHPESHRFDLQRL